MSLPRTLPVKQKSVLIAALSGRALAQAARASGYAPLVADFFADLDLRATATRWELLPGNLQDGFDGPALVAALQRLAKENEPVALVCGSGFEKWPELLRELEEEFPLAGNRWQTVARLKCPETLAAICAELAIDHPEVTRFRPARPSGWLSKLQGGAGGWHVISAADAPDDKQRYFQRRVAGRAVSAMFLADGRSAHILGFSRQWSAPLPGRTFNYGGAVRPAAILPAAEKAMRNAVTSLVAALGLVGLNSADFIVQKDRAWLLEVNARPGATLDIYEDLDGRLFEAHLQACRGNLPRKRLKLNAASASAILFTTRRIENFGFGEWPHWVRDRQAAGTAIPQGGPVCTVTASAKSARAALDLVRRRVREMDMWTQEAAA